jgi:transposase
MAISYIGADVDCKMTEFAVERNGKITDRDRVPTDIRSMSNFLSSISGRKIMTVEEGPMAGWLYRNLKSKVDNFIVCDPRRNKLICSDGDKDDAIDAGALAMLLRGGFLREVYHTDDEERLALKEAVALYHDRVRDSVRQINKLRGCCHCHGVKIPTSILKDPLVRKRWLKELKPAILAHRVSVLLIGYDAVAKQVKMVKKDIAQHSKSYPIIEYWKDIPGIGPIRAITLFAYLDTPWRFDSPKKLWKYCGIGLKRFASGSDKNGKPKPGKLRLYRGANRKLIDAVIGAALSAVTQSNNPFKTHYERMLSDGVTPNNARHTTSRKILSVMYGMWKTNCRYDENLV